MTGSLTGLLTQKTLIFQGFLDICQHVYCQPDKKDQSGKEKKNLKVSDLMDLFAKASNGEFANDRMLLG